MHNLVCYLDSTKSINDKNCSRKVWSSQLTFCSTHKSIQTNDDVLNLSELNTGDIALNFDGGLLFGPDYILWSSNGDIILVSSDDNHFELVYKSDIINDCILSPDESILIILNHTLLTLLDVYSWTPLSEVNLLENCCSNSVDMSSKRCSWKNNGDYFAISFSNTNVHIYDRDGNLISCIEPLEGLLALSGLSIRPEASSLVAIPQKKPSGDLVIALIQKNGLKHAEISVNKSITIRDIQWNSTGSVLAVLGCKDESTTSSLYLYTSSNATWSVPYMTYFKSNDERIVWDTENAMQLHICSSNTRRTLCFRNQVLIHNGFYAAVDGPNVRISNLKKHLIPVPSCAFKVGFDESVQCATLGDDDTLNILLHGGEFLILGGVESADNPVIDMTSEVFEVEERFTKYKTILKKKYKDSLLLCNLTWIKPGVFLASIGSTLRIITLDASSDHSSITMDEDIIAITHFKSTNIIQTKSGRLYQYKEGRLTTPWSHCTAIPEPCTDVKISMDEKTYYGLSSTHRLYANKREIASGITSFILNKEFLLFVTFQHRLNIYCSVKKDASFSRRVERGSTLLYSFDSSVLLGMPRGNFELICPKPLLLSYIRRLLNELEYRKALPFFRKHCIDFNLLFDHDPELLMKNLGVFIEALDSNELAHFISNLREDNVTANLYHFAYVDNNAVFERKVEILTEEIRKLCLNREDFKDHRAILYTYIKDPSRRISDALHYINGLRNNNSLAEAKECLKHLSHLLTSKEIFNGSLSTYDLDFALFIASNSTSSDPKEFLPFLNSLKVLSPLSLRHFTIEKHLKNYKNALNHASQSDFPSNELSEVLNLIQEKRLYAMAQGSFVHEHPFYPTLCEAYGDYLASKRHFRDAALIYDLGGHKRKGVEAWIHSGHWRDAIISNEADAQSAIEFLKAEEGRHEEIAEIYLTHLKHPEEAINALILGGVWDRARELIVRYERTDMFEVNYMPVLEEKAKEHLTFIEETSKAFKVKFTRLQVLNEKHNQVSEKDPNDSEEEEVDFNDAYSESSRITSASRNSSSRKSSRTGVSTLATRASLSKDKKKAQRKIYCSKEGSVYEDIALIAELHGIISKVYLSKHETKKLLGALVQARKLPLASKIQKEFKDLLKLISYSLTKIWIKKVEDAEEEPSKQTYIPPYQLLEEVLRFPPISVDVTWDLHFLSE